MPALQGLFLIPEQTVRIGDAVHVLHAFQKKSKSGIATPRPDVELIEKRLKAVLARYGMSGRT
jgi:phage-related protein